MRSKHPSRLFLFSLVGTNASVSWVYQRTDDKVPVCFVPIFLVGTDALLGLGGILCDFLYIIFSKDIFRPPIETLPLIS